MKQIAPILAIIGGLLLLFGGGDTPGPQPATSPAAEILRQCQSIDMASKLDLLQEMASKTFPGDTPGERAIPASDWWLEQSSEKRIEAYTPFTDALAEAIDSETVGVFVGAK